MARTERLGVWLEGIRIADLTEGRGGAMRARYTDEALDLWPLNSPVMSCSLPLGERALPALAFCRGLLPEGDALRTLAEQAGLAAGDTFGLLERYGRDVAGALVIAEEEPAVREHGVEELSEADLGGAFDELDVHPLGSHDDSELSLAGLQDKLLLVDLGKRGWGRPLHGRPSTHILKVDDPRRPGLIEAEAECLRLACTLSLTTVEPELRSFGEYRCIVMPRFDRRTDSGTVRRVHQEDLCQATGTDPSQRQGRSKYERAGGPTLKAAAALLDSYAADAPAQLDRLVATVAFTALIGNADAHGKNLAFLHPDPERIELAPLYDTVPTALWPKLRTEAAMSIGGQVSLTDVTLKDIVREAVIWRHQADRAEHVARDTIDSALTAIAEGTIPSKSPLAKFVTKRARQLIRSR
jgi:serine/threonine-protein kinase HipA